MTDAELVELARRGNRDACNRLVERHQAAVYRAALAALRVPEDAEEAAQDAFVRAFAALDRYRGEASFRTWVLKIAWRRALSRRRSDWWRRLCAVRFGVQSVAAHRPGDQGFHAERTGREAVPDVPDDGPGPERCAAGVELHRHVCRLIAALPAMQRDALLLAAAGDYSYEEIAAMLEIPVGTLKWRVSDARRRLRAELAALGYDQRF